MKILGIIPAREGSKRLPDKNIRLLGGKPLIRWSIDNSLNSKMLDRIIVNTDSQTILDLANQYSDEKLVFLERPAEISGDKSRAVEYVNHSLEYLSGNGEEFDIVVIIQPTSPLTLPSDIDQTVHLLIDTNADTSVSVVKLPHDINPLKLKILEGDKLNPYIEGEDGRMSEGEMPDVYVRNGSVYAIKKEVIESGRILGDDCRGYIMPRERSVDINDKFDLEFAEFLFSKAYESRNNV